VNTDDLRAAFELKAKAHDFFRHCSFVRLSDGDYFELAVQSAFVGYQLNQDESKVSIGKTD
jgi:hypothetical protein